MGPRNSQSHRLSYRFASLLFSTCKTAARSEARAQTGVLTSTTHRARSRSALPGALLFHRRRSKLSKTVGVHRTLSFHARQAVHPVSQQQLSPIIRSYLLISSLALRLLLFHSVPRENPSLRTYQLNVVLTFRRGGDSTAQRSRKMLG